MNTGLIDINNQEILTNINVSVFDPVTFDLIGWGWFEYNPEDGLWFREDYNEHLPKGMDSNVIQNITNYKFEILE